MHVTGSGNGAHAGEVFSDAAVSSSTPCCFLVARGIGPFVTEAQIVELFRQFAVVKSAVLLRDQMTGTSRGIAYVEFHSTEQATFALQRSQQTQLTATDGGNPLKV
jgi:RNA recognition motif-containing protein